TMTISNLDLPDVSSTENADGDSKSDLSWVLPSTVCFDQFVVFASYGSNVSYVPTGDASSYDADSEFGSGTDLGSNQYVVYKGVDTAFTITSLTNNQTYYAKIFVRKGTEWSTGVELILNPAIATILGHGDLAILAVNTQSGFGTSGDEISIVSFKAIAPNTSIDFTDNGYERKYAGKWGDTEGTIRITRKKETLDAGKVVTIEISGSPANLSIGTHINIYVDGINDNNNWTASKLGGLTFNLATDDQLWVMQNGDWVKDPADNNNATYSGNVLYGWTSTSWESSPGYSSTEGSTIYPGCECATTNVSGLTNKSKVKYAGSFEPANKFEWISRINNPENWTGFASNSAFEAGEPRYKNGRSLGITECDTIETKWMGYKSIGWCDCSNWYNLRVPDENADVEIAPYNAGRFDLKLCEHVDSLAVCRNLTVKGNIYNTTNATLKVKGNFTLDGGSVYFNDSAMNFEIGGNINIDTSGNFKISKANIKLNGSADQNIEGNSEIVFGTLTVDKPSSDVILSKDIKVDSLNLTKGKIFTGANRVYVNDTATDAITVNANNLSYINGNLRRAVADTGSYAIPVGNASNLELATVVLNSSTNLIYLDVRFDNYDDSTSMDISNLNLRVGGTLLQTLLDAGYWTITPNPELAEINYDVKLDMRGATNTGDRATQHTIVKRDSSLSNWYLEGTLDTATQTINNGVVHAEITGLTSFSHFSIAKNNDTPLPVELISFNAKCNNNFIELNWITVTETNSDYFIVQRSDDAINWKSLDKIQAAGNSSSISKYEYIDITRVSGNLYYRLIQVDFDGTTSLSNIVSVNCSDKFENSQITIYPNPANDILYFSEAHSFKIFDIYGRLLKQSEKEQSSVNISDLKKGMYYIKFENNLLKFIKN
ncbi:MAG TPA: T9SS type A sorting domain-containing protein, partial [Salinivirgaceae bacterium]|nr:T9SS type A sorting domain-containing protein [Salinivirgaceae bacterium]